MQTRTDQPIGGPSARSRPTTPASTAPPPATLRRVGRDTLIYGGAFVLSKFISFLMLPIYTRYLTPADYGTLQLITTTLDAVEIFAGAGLVSGIFYLFHKADTEGDRRAVLSSAFVVMLTSYCAAGVVAYGAAPFMAGRVLGGAGDAGLLRIAAVSLALSCATVVPLAYLQVSGAAIGFVAASVGRLLLQVVLNVYFLVVLGLGVKAVLLSTLLTNLVIGGGLVAYFIRRVGLHVSWPNARALLRFGVPLVAVQVGTFIATFGDRYFLKAAADTSVVGVYALAYQFGFLLAALGSVPFEKVWEPARFAIAKRPDRDDVFARSFVYYNVLLLTVAVGIVLFVHDVLRIMAAPAYWGAASLVPVILIAIVLQSWTPVHNLGIMMRERTELITWANWAAAAVALGGYAWLIPRYLGLGAAVATVLAYAVRAIMVYVLSQRLWPVAYRWGPILRLLGLATAVTVARSAVPATTPLLSSIVGSVVLLVAYGVGVLYAGVLSREERDALYRAVRSPHTSFVNLLTRS